VQSALSAHRGLGLDTLGLPALSGAAAKELSRLFEENSSPAKEPLRILPALIHCLYFLSLLQSKKFDLLFVAATRTALALRSCAGGGGAAALSVGAAGPSPAQSAASAQPQSLQPQPQLHLAAVLEGIMNEVAAPKFAKFLDRLLAKPPAAASGASGAAGSASVGASLPKLQAAALTIVNMAFNMDYVPEALAKILPKYFKARPLGQRAGGGGRRTAGGPADGWLTGGRRERGDAAAALALLVLFSRSLIFSFSLSLSLSLSVCPRPSPRRRAAPACPRLRPFLISASRSATPRCSGR
jgi:hypothetical protein